MPGIHMKTIATSISTRKIHAEARTGALRPTARKAARLTSLRVRSHGRARVQLPRIASARRNGHNALENYLPVPGSISIYESGPYIHTVPFLLRLYSLI